MKTLIISIALLFAIGCNHYSFSVVIPNDSELNSDTLVVDDTTRIERPNIRE